MLPENVIIIPLWPRFKLESRDTSTASNDLDTTPAQPRSFIR